MSWSGSTSLSSLYLQTQNVRSASPWAGPSQSISVCPCPFSTVLLLDFLARWLEKEIARPETVYKYVPLHSASSESALPLGVLAAVVSPVSALSPTPNGTRVCTYRCVLCTDPRKTRSHMAMGKNLGTAGMV